MHSRTGSLTCHPVELCRTLWWGIVNSYCVACDKTGMDIAILWFTATATTRCIENCLELSTHNRPLVTYSEYFSASSVELSYWWKRALGPATTSVYIILTWSTQIRISKVRSPKRSTYQMTGSSITCAEGRLMTYSSIRRLYCFDCPIVIRSRACVWPTACNSFCNVFAWWNFIIITSAYKDATKKTFWRSPNLILNPPATILSPLSLFRWPLFELDFYTHMFIYILV